MLTQHGDGIRRQLDIAPAASRLGRLSAKAGFCFFEGTACKMTDKASAGDTTLVMSVVEAGRKLGLCCPLSRFYTRGRNQKKCGVQGAASED
jgi:hypothetical protein